MKQKDFYVLADFHLLVKSKTRTLTNEVEELPHRKRQLDELLARGFYHVTPYSLKIFPIYPSTFLSRPLDNFIVYAKRSIHVTPHNPQNRTSIWLSIFAHRMRDE